MGQTYASIRIYSETAKRSKELRLLVDTGSAFTWVPRELLRRLGIRPMGVRRFRTIDGRILEREVGEATLEFDGERATRILVFSKKGDAEVLGVDALEGLALEVDPVNKTLRKVEAFLAV